MNNSYILLRHAHSRFSSDDFNRTLSEEGFVSLKQLEFLNSFNIDYYFSSPYKRAFETILLSSHGNLLGILINHFDPNFDYKKWKQMTFPDCLLVDKDDSVKRIMKVTSG